MNVKSSSSAKIRRELKAAGGTHGPVLKIWVVFAAEICGFEGYSGRKMLVEFFECGSSHFWY